MWYLFSILLIVIPIAMGAAAYLLMYARDEFYKFSYYENYEDEPSEG